MPITTNENDIKEQLSIAFVSAIAAHAGCQITSWPLDKVSVDLGIRPVSGMRACVDLQVKATSKKIVYDQEVFFDLTMKNYDDLRAQPQTNPHYLIVVRFPGILSKWLKLSAEQLAIRGVAYYGNLVGLPAVANDQNRRVRMPIAQRFTPMALRDMILVAPQRIGGPGIHP